MRKDVEFLRRNSLMDYSLLIAIEKTSISNHELHIEPEAPFTSGIIASESLVQ
jgi:hypothetical protein